MMDPAARREAEDRLERAVCGLVVAALEAERRDVTVLGRPDRENRTARQADFLLNIDGVEVALEVTRTASTGLQRKALLSSRVAERLHEALDAEIEQMRQGHAVLHFELAMTEGQPPPRRIVDQVVPELAERVRAALPRAIAARERLAIGEVGPVIDLSLRVSSTDTHQLSVLCGIIGGAIQPIADDAVGRTITGKASQLAGYDLAYIALIEPTKLLAPQDIGEAFSRARDVPANWRRVYVIDGNPGVAMLAWEAP